VSLLPDGVINGLLVVRSSGMSREHRLLDKTAADHLASCKFAAAEGSTARRFTIDYKWQLPAPELPASAANP
jgi:hypothetical protein